MVYFTFSTEAQEHQLNISLNRTLWIGVENIVDKYKQQNWKSIISKWKFQNVVSYKKC